MSSKGRLVLWLSDVLARSRAWYYCYRIPRPLVDRLLPKDNILYSSGLCIFCNLGRCDVMCRNRRRSLCEIPAREVHVVPERANETYGTASSSEYTGSSEERSIRCRLRDGDRGKDVQVVPSPSTGKARRHLHISFRASTDIIFADTTTTTTVIPACSGINNLQPYSSLLCGKRPEPTTRKICSERG